ncbi:cell-division protein [Streptococcus pneumoniae]|nr:cell-division protein [Streptococcus pneumoniae]
MSGVYKNPKTSKEETGIQFFTPTATTVERFSSTILPSDSTVSELQKLASEHQAEVTVKHESSSGMWINILVSVLPEKQAFHSLASQDLTL